MSAASNAVVVTHTSDLSSRMLRSWSREEPRAPSFRRACAVMRDASDPPFGCCRLRSCEQFSPSGSNQLQVEQRCKARGSRRRRACMSATVSLAMSLESS